LQRMTCGADMSFPLIFFALTGRAEARRRWGGLARATPGGKAKEPWLPHLWLVGEGVAAGTGPSMEGATAGAGRAVGARPPGSPRRVGVKKSVDAHERKKK